MLVGAMFAVCQALFAISRAPNLSGGCPGGDWEVGAPPPSQIDWIFGKWEVESGMWDVGIERLINQFINIAKWHAQSGTLEVGTGK